MSTPREPTAAGMAVRTAVILFIFVVVFTALLAGAYLGTKPAIEASAAEEKMKLIAEVLPTSAYDNDLLQDTLRLPPTPELGLDEPSTVYRARQGKAPAAVVLEAVAPDGYSGKIRLLLAVHADGRIAGVRVTQHKETPGLGDYIEVRKDKVKNRPWISQFTGQGFATIAERDWKVKKDGGQFDYYAGATISPRAVTKAVGKALKFANEHREQLYGEAK